MNPFDIYGALGATAAGIIGAATTIIELIMRAIWDAALFILREAFKLADRFSVLSVSTTEGPIGILWPMLLWISGVLALGLFFWQIVVTTLRGGRGFTRLVAGPFQYGVALAVTVGMVGAFLTSTDALTTAILDYSLHTDKFEDALDVTGFLDVASDGIKAVVLGLAGLVGVVPAGIGYVLEMLFREAAIYVLVATTPLTAAGLLADVTAVWFWRSVRWMLAAIAMKPVLALTLVLGIAIAGGSQGLSGLLAGVGVLLISLLVPLVLFRLFAFVDPNTDAGAAFRTQLSKAGIDSYGANSPAGLAAQAAVKRYRGNDDEEEDDGGGSEQEQANTDRFDRAADEGSQGPQASGVGERDSDTHTSAKTTTDQSASAAEPADDDQTPPAADTERPEDPERGGDDDPPPPGPPDGGGGTPPPPPPSGPTTGGGGGGSRGASEKEIEESAVVA